MNSDLYVVFVEDPNDDRILIDAIQLCLRARSYAMRCYPEANMGPPTPTSPASLRLSGLAWS